MLGITVRLFTMCIHSAPYLYTIIIRNVEGWSLLLWFNINTKVFVQGFGLAVKSVTAEYIFEGIV